MPDLELPCTPVEDAVAQAWAQVLGIEPIARTDRFTDLGGTSLGAEKTLLVLRRILGRDIGADLLTGDPTVAELAQLIDDAAAKQFASSTPTTTRLGTGTGRPVFFFAGAGASAVSFLHIAAQLSGRRPAWAFHAHGFHSRGLADPTLGLHARRHLGDLRRIQPSGPVSVVGHSFGGHIAMECARRLRRSGREVDRIVLLDTVLPAPGESVGDVAVGERADQQSSWAQRMRRHAEIYSAGLVRHDVRTQQDIFWEHAIRIQNRIRLTGVPDKTTIFITDDNAIQVERWSALDPAPTIRRIPGNHLSPLNDPQAIREIVGELA
ncbi:alpha/beta fold hydrolase [Corynebacterium sp. TAE3-ERU12]|uniref:alpha/beta fold hydrolase n=1 Tax=Corynebacterium sp. TAE3-ERU12 TaxID=2849491 RepID=UPI001C43793A|nr:alpha/beta hydrolase [Corynebacterium sp. TAE3-ERU12]MBV7295632.1 alpha/beta fold hydrolase [Corynebacterium sp. TAE3-ERU12]